MAEAVSSSFKANRDRDEIDGAAESRKQTNFVLRHGQRILHTINLCFIVLGSCTFVWALLYEGRGGIYSKMYSEGTGYDFGTAIGSLGIVCAITALLGNYGARHDNKCCLLIYFIMSFGALVSMLTMAGLAFDAVSGDLDADGSVWWDDFKPSTREQVQEEFDCCGYNDPMCCDSFDGGDGYVAYPPGSCCLAEDDWCAARDETALQIDTPESGASFFVCSGEWVQDRPSPLVNDEGDFDGGETAACRSSAVNATGCRAAGVQAIEDKAVPAFLLGMVTGSALLFALCLASYLLCRRTHRPKQTAGVKGVSGWNTYDVTAGFGDDDDGGAGGEGESKGLVMAEQT